MSGAKKKKTKKILLCIKKIVLPRCWYNLDPAATKKIRRNGLCVSFLTAVGIPTYHFPFYPGIINLSRQSIIYPQDIPEYPWLIPEFGSYPILHTAPHEQFDTVRIVE